MNTVAANRDVVESLLTDVLETGDIAAIDHLAHPNVHVSDVAFETAYRGIDEWAGHFEMLRRAFSDIDVTFGLLSACEDVLTVEYRFDGVHTGPFMGQPASGNRITFGGIDVYRFADGKIRSVRSAVDLFGVLSGIDAVSLPTPRDMES